MQLNHITIVVSIISIAMLGTAQGQRAEVSGDWIVTTDTNPMDSVKTVTALKDSVEQPTAALVIRCKGKQAEVYVRASEVVSEEYGVRIKFDEGKANRQSWERATSYDALFSPAPGDLLRNMKVGKTFYFEYTPYQRAARVVSFDVSKIPERIYAACVTEEIEKADARLKKAAEDQVKLLAQQKQEREDNEKRLAALRVKCAPFADESVEKIEMSQSPLPPKECWEFMGGSSGGYEDLVKKRELCSLPSFAHDPKFCGGQADSSDIGNVKAKAAQRLTDQKIIDQCVGDPIGTSALKDNCTHKWFSDFHPDACEWVSHQTGK